MGLATDHVCHRMRIGAGLAKELDLLVKRQAVNAGYKGVMTQRRLLAGVNVSHRPGFARAVARLPPLALTFTHHAFRKADVRAMQFV